MFSLHIGGELQLPVRAKAAPAAPVAAAAASPKERDVFDGVPLRAWAEVCTTVLVVFFSDAICLTRSILSTCRCMQKLASTVWRFDLSNAADSLLL